MISKTVKAKLMERLRKKSTSKYPVNIFKERLFTDQSVRYLTERYRSGEITRTNMYARLGETAGLLLMALSDGYNIIDVARAAKVTPCTDSRSFLQYQHYPLIKLVLLCSKYGFCAFPLSK
jgi:hypothetical protein